MTEHDDGRTGLLTPDQVAAQFGVEARTVGRWRKRGLITPTGPWTRPYLYSQAEVDRLKTASAAAYAKLQYPEHEKLHAVKDTSQSAGEFYEWLCDQGWHLVRYDDRGRPVPVLKPVRELLAMWLGIDLSKIDQEKEQMIEQMRKANLESVK